MYTFDYTNENPNALYAQRTTEIFLSQEKKNIIESDLKL